ncbi:hypothetical protein KP79_PYT22152 [Mizuhopecten yessoensis]|uniref:Uncharacterized protein n=1 Tax=Mizuhopecten yessoensis TaxID=6573 RepID=A0A210QUK1_MIZYE|nr:hypothetical protein KP79_PYT22152 [Mizuhopecten yessoensis]
MKMTDRTIGLKIIIVAMVLLQSATSDVKNESVMKEGADPNMVLLQSATSELKSESLMKEGADPNMYGSDRKLALGCLRFGYIFTFNIVQRTCYKIKAIFQTEYLDGILSYGHLEDIKLKYQTHQTHQQIPMASCCGTDNSQLVRILKMIVQENKRILGGMRMPPLLQENEDIKLKYQTHQTHQQIPMASCCGTDNSQLVRILKMIVQENKRILGGMRMPPLLQENEVTRNCYKIRATCQVDNICTELTQTYFVKRSLRGYQTQVPNTPNTSTDSNGILLRNRQQSISQNSEDDCSREQKDTWRNEDAAFATGE